MLEVFVTSVCLSHCGCQLRIYIHHYSVKDKAKYIVCQNGRSKSSLICQNPVRSVIAIYRATPQKVVILCERRKKKKKRMRKREERKRRKKSGK